MNTGKYVFSQLVEFLPKRIFDGIAERHDSNKYVKHFTCWNQLLAMMFGQLTNRESLRDLIVAIDAHSSKCYHLGFGKNVTRSNLSKANENRDFKIFEEYAYHLIEIARKKRSNSDFEIQGKVYAFDSTTIDLCLSIFWWAKFRSTKGGLKLHTLYDITTQIPAFVHITPASVHDMNAMDVIPYEHGAYYIFDRGYMDFARLYNVTRHSAYFVIRAKRNLKLEILKDLKRSDSSEIIISDHIVRLDGFSSYLDYPENFRRVRYYDADTKRPFTYLTNNLEITAEQVALLYKNRWQIELFFKWIKQHLKIKSFWGTTENAVRIQIYSAIITYCLVAIVEHDLNIKRSTYEVLQVLGISLLDKTPIMELFNSAENNDVNELLFNQQLSLNF
ncbi:IS4 family transposase [Bacteroidales bacterium MB20-C3-3]|nr:IS4 family transposase [Bacteroidales bacterium MB20-C3-3]